MTRRKRRRQALPGDSRRRFSPPEPQSQARIHPSILIDDREVAQEREIETLLVDNHRLAAAHVALKQDLSVVEQELRLLSTTAATVKADRDAEVRELYEKARKRESDIRIADELSAEMARVRADVQNLDADREELTAKLQEREDDLVKVRLDLQEFTLLKAEIEAIQKEVQRGRAAIEYEKKTRASNLEYSQAMEKQKITLACEIEKLHAELANAEKRARAAVAAAAPSNLNHQFANYGNPETGYGGNLYPAPYAVLPVQDGADSSTHYIPGSMPYASQPYAHH